jgi:hypothetical protein
LPILLPATPFSAIISTPQISIASLTNINPPIPISYTYCHQVVFYITYKLLVGH